MKQFNQRHSMVRVKVLSILFSIFLMFPSVAFSVECVGVDTCPPQVKKIVKFARNGSPDAQLMLAALYDDGHLLVQDHQKAFKWYRKATRQPKKISVAYFKVGLAYLEGKGVEKDVEKGIKNVVFAARHHHTPSQMLLGLMYFQGDDVAKDLSKARYWFKEAAKSNDAKAAYAYAQMNEFGLGGAKNIQEARKWYLVSSARGYQRAMLRAEKLNPSQSEQQQAQQQVAAADQNNVNKGNILTVYGNQMNEMQMMSLVLDNIKESGFYSNVRTGSHIPGHNCLDDRMSCQYISDKISIQRLLGVGRPLPLGMTGVLQSN